MTQQFTAQDLEQIQKLTNESMNVSHKSLIDRAIEMENSEMYVDLTDYCYEKMEEYIDNPIELEKILTNPKYTEEIFKTISNLEEFKQFEAEEMRNFPRVVLTTIITGSEAQAAHHAAEIVKEDHDEATRLEALAETYQNYLHDALRYGRGEDKKVAFTGEKNQ